MIFGSMKEVFLSRARDIFLFDCRVAGLDPQAIVAYREVLDSFILFTGDLRIRQLTPDHVNLYIDNLSDGRYDAEEHKLSVMSQHLMIQTWIQWIFSQKFVTERSGRQNKPPTNLFPSRFAGGLFYDLWY